METTKRLMDDVKLGKQVDMKRVESTVEKMTASVLNHKDALVSLLRIKNADEYTYQHSLGGVGPMYFVPRAYRVRRPED